MTITPKTTIEEVTSWINKAKEEKKWLIFMFHQVDLSEDEYSVSPFMLQEILAAIEDSELPVVVPSEVIQLKIAHE